MNITSAKDKNSTIKLTVELSDLEMDKYLNNALEKLSKQINVKGFRPGKVPLEVAKQQISPQYLLAQAIDLALPPTYMEAVKQEKLEPISRPTVNVITENPLKYEAIVPIYPEVTIKDYKKIKLTKAKIEITDDLINEEIKKFQKYHAKFQDVQREAKEGDRVEIDFQGFDEGGAILDGTTSKNHPIIIGEKSFVPGFEENLIGMNLNDEREFTVTFPKDYFHKPFQSKLVKFKVKVNRIEERNFPEIDSDFIKKVAGKEMTIDQFKKEINDNLIKQKEFEDQQKLESELFELIAEKTSVEIPEVIIEDEIHYIIDELKDSLAQKGVNWDDYLKAVNKTHQDLHKDKHQEAIKRVKLRFGIQEIFKQEKIEVSDKELEKALEDENKIFESMNYQPKLNEIEEMKLRLKNKLKMDKLVALFT